MAHVAARLMERYPDCTREQIEAILDEEHALYVGRPVIDVIPIDVERAAQHRLAQHATAEILRRAMEAAVAQDRRSSRAPES